MSLKHQQACVIVHHTQTCYHWPAMICAVIQWLKCKTQGPETLTWFGGPYH